MPDSEWVKKAEYLESAGLTDGWLRGHIQRKTLVRGKHVAIDGRTTMVNVEAMNQWWAERNQQTSTSTARISASGSSTKAARTLKSSPETTTPRVTSPLRFAGATR